MFCKSYTLHIHSSFNNSDFYINPEMQEIWLQLTYTNKICNKYVRENDKWLPFPSGTYDYLDNNNINEFYDKWFLSVQLNYVSFVMISFMLRDPIVFVMLPLLLKQVYALNILQLYYTLSVLGCNGNLANLSDSINTTCHANYIFRN